MIHKYTMLGRFIVLDVASGAVHEVDELTYDLLGKVVPPMTEKPPFTCSDAELEAWSEIYELYSSGLLFSEDTPVPTAPGKTVIKAICLHVAHDCNLRCSYCFASTGDFGMTRGIMSPEVGKKAVDYLLARCGSRNNLEIDFFGGEPLMAFETVKAVVDYARETAPNKRFRFTITTNGLLLNDEINAYINENMDNVVLSLDGREAVNDFHRKTVSGQGSYRHIVPKYKALIKDRDKDYFIRGTFTAKNLDFVSDIEAMDKEGFENLSLEPVVLGNDNPLAIKPEHLPFLFNEYERLTEKVLKGTDFSFFHFAVDLEQGPCIYKRVRGCGAGYEYAAITPQGDVYPCHQFVGLENYKLGSVLDGSFDEEKSKYFGSLNIDTKSECKLCWARFYCSGGCHASNLTAEGHIEKAYSIGCELEKKRLECAILLKAVEINPN